MTMNEVNKSDQAVLEIRALRKHFPIEKGIFKKVVGHVRAVEDVDLKIMEGETLGVVGESGCGKTTLGRTILRALDPSSGQILFRTRENKVIDLAAIHGEQLRPFRKELQMVFQDPYASLDPRMTVLDIIGEPLVVNGWGKGREYDLRIRELAEQVGLNLKHLKRFPHAFSGGQRQRVGIARALATNPRFIVGDEPVSALDVSIQAQILNLLQDLQDKLTLTYLFIAHDLRVVEYIADSVAVMYVGKVVERAETGELFSRPLHPYTEALLSSAPVPDPKVKKKRVVLPGEPANPANPPSGCYFHPRCPYAQEVCRAQEPPLEEIYPGHFSACHFARELDLKGAPSGTGHAPWMKKKS